MDVRCVCVCVCGRVFLSGLRGHYIIILFALTAGVQIYYIPFVQMPFVRCDYGRIVIAGSALLLHP